MSPASAQNVKILDEQVAERIAAGEVIERPASIVKELVENALDAGATEVAVQLEDGGRQLVQVTDNGRGMGPGDLALAPKRHATSKIRELGDLEKLSTLGFRGEALPSITAVSELSIVSKTGKVESAYQWKPSFSRANKKTFGHFRGSQHGTQIKAENLFAQIPARLKFLKSPRAELSYIRDWIEKLALTRPDVGFLLENNKKKVLEFRPQTIQQRILKILADGNDVPLLENEVKNIDPKIEAKAYWLQGLSNHQSKKIVQVVNGRILKDRLIHQGIMSAFKQSLLPGKYPALLLDLKIDPAEMDVNVHPTKTEVRFTQPSQIFKTVQRVFDSLVNQSGTVISVGTALEQSGLNASLPPRPKWKAAEKTESFDFQYNTEPATPVANSSSEVAESANEQSDSQPVTTKPKHPLLNSLTSNQYVGNLFTTYMLYDEGSEVILVDQHAAHERIRYEKLKTQVLNNAVATQELLIPEALQIDPDHLPQLNQRVGWLKKMGFDVEIFGEQSVIFRSIPAVWGKNQIKLRLKNLIDQLLNAELPEEGNFIVDEALFEKIASEACHSAVRAGDRVSAEQAQTIVNELFDCQHPWNCPHGRPTIVKVSRGKFEEWFQRKI